MTYSERFQASIPSSLYQIGRAIARALDPDVGGAENWGPELQGDPPTAPDRYTTDFPCTAEFKAQAVAMLADPALLHAAVAQDYATRWPDLVPPTLAECEAFCAGVQIGGASALG